MGAYSVLVFLTQRVLWPLTGVADVADVADMYQRSMAAIDRTIQLLDTPSIFPMKDYGNTGIDKPAIFDKCLLPLLEFSREREGIDLSKVVLTHHHLVDQGARTLPLGTGETPKLAPPSRRQAAPACRSSKRFTWPS